MITEIDEIFKVLKNVYKDNFYIEIQRHDDVGEKAFEFFLLKKSKELEIPLMASHEVFYFDKEMQEAHDALLCIGEKTYINEKNRKKYSNQHYLKNNDEMCKVFSDLPEALENNFNFPYRCSYKPKKSVPLLPNIKTNSDTDLDLELFNLSKKGLKEKD